MRKMATIRIIDSILPIEGADAIEVAVIGGWKVVVKKNEYSAGDKVIYCEIDSWIPTDIAPFLTKAGHEPKEYNGVKGERLRTVKLRGQVSQGLVLPVFSDITGTYLMVYDDENGEYSVTVSEGDDVSEVLGIQKWEPSQEFMASNSKGNFPSFIRKTDQERVQNLKRELQKAIDSGEDFEVSEKLDGSSMTVYYNDGVFGVCSRNLELKEDANNTFWATALKYNLREKLINYGTNIAIQGELIGPGIQGNKYGLTEFQFRVFNVFDIDRQEYYSPSAAGVIIQHLNMVLHLEIDTVPILNTWYSIPKGTTIDDLLKQAEGKSKLNPNTEREGLVFKSEHGNFSFKAISNKWLMKNE